jgi:hypothetical protein
MNTNIKLILKKFDWHSEVHTESGEVVFISNGTKPEEQKCLAMILENENKLEINKGGINEN